MRFLYLLWLRVRWAWWLTENRGLTWRRAWITAGIYRRIAEQYVRSFR